MVSSDLADFHHVHPTRNERGMWSADLALQPGSHRAYADFQPRDGDLAYLHVHPLDDEPTGPVRFAVEVPSAGTYGFYFDFALEGTVHTAAFAAVIDSGPNAAEDIADTPSTPNAGPHGH